MINSTPPSERIARPDLVAPASLKFQPVRPSSDRFSAANSTALHASLAAQPEIRPEIVARGRALAADPSYPSPEVLRQIGVALLRAPDLSEDAS